MKGSFIIEKDVQIEKKNFIANSKSGSEQNLGKFYFNFLNGKAMEEKKK